MSDNKDGFRSVIDRSNALRALQIPKEGLIGCNAVEHSDEPLNMRVTTVPEGVRIECNREVKDFALPAEHATSLGLALIQNAVISKFKAAQASAQKAGPGEVKKL